MAITGFPPLESADEYGLIAVGGDLEVESLLLAYKNGIFPWPSNNRVLAWFSPPTRAVLKSEDLHLSQSFKRFLKQNPYRCTIDIDFENVIRRCAGSKNRKGQRGTWITSKMIDAYIELHKAGYAHSIECWEDKELVGGIYGVSIGAMFAAESMFYLKPNASKLALYSLVQLLSNQGINWLDAQVINPFLSQLGFKEITRDHFMKLLIPALKKPGVKFDRGI